LRIYAVLRRQVRSQIVHIGRYEFDTLSKKLYLDGTMITLSIKASELLLILLKGQGNIVSFSQIKQRLWSASEEISEGSLRVYITQLKKYFPTQIENIRGIGYRMDRYVKS